MAKKSGEAISWRLNGGESLWQGRKTAISAKCYRKNINISWRKKMAWRQLMAAENEANIEAKYQRNQLSKA
jgi:hypothetical protein